MKLIFVRYGRTYFNEIRLTQGWCDSPLSKTGQKQVQDMRRQLLDIPITRAYSSNLGRAVETAEVLLEDREVELVYRLHIESPDWLNDMQMDYRLYKGEEIQDVIKRHYDFLEDIQAKYSDDDTILIVGHGCSLYAFVKSLLT